MSQQDEQALVVKFRNVELPVIKFVLHSIAGGNLQLAQDTLQHMPPTELNALKEKILGKNFKKELTGAQKQMVQDFVGIAASSKKTAAKFLENNAWKLDEALNMYFQAGGVSEPDDPEEEIAPEPVQVKQDPAKVEKKLEELFDEYRKADQKAKEAAVTSAVEDPNAEHMQANALMEFAKDLDVDATKDSTLFVIGYMIGAKTASYTFTKEEFVKGFEAQGCTTLLQVKEKLAEWKKTVQSQSRNFYRYVFTFATPSKKLRPTTAISLWKIVLPCEMASSTNFVEYCDYLSNSLKGPVTRDIWNETYDFMEIMQPGFTNYDFVGQYWNSTIDEFIESKKKK